MTKVLIVEDNDMNLDMLSRRLSRKGFAVVSARDGKAGVEAAAREMPDIVLMDISLPVMDGWEATRAIKADPATGGIPVIALTAHAMDEDRSRALDAGCDEFHTKPIDLPSLLEKIGRLVPGGDDGGIGHQPQGGGDTGRAASCRPGRGDPGLPGDDRRGSGPRRA